METRAAPRPAGHSVRYESRPSRHHRNVQRVGLRGGRNAAAALRNRDRTQTRPCPSKALRRALSDGACPKRGTAGPDEPQGRHRRWRTRSGERPGGRRTRAAAVPGHHAPEVQRAGAQRAGRITGARDVSHQRGRGLRSEVHIVGGCARRGVPGKSRRGHPDCAVDRRDSDGAAVCVVNDQVGEPFEPPALLATTCQ